MIQSPGRGLGGPQKRCACARFHLIKTLPPVFTYTRNDTVATFRDGMGKLRKASANMPRFDHDADGFPQGILMEGAIQNKITLYNAVPTATTGITVSGTASVSLAGDGEALAEAGLEQLVTGNVFRASGGASGGTVTLPGITGSTSVHSLSVYARILAGTQAVLTHSGTAAGTQVIMGTTWARHKLENQTISGTFVQMQISIHADTTLLFILPQLEQNRFCSSVIVTAGSVATRQRDDLVISSLGSKAFWNVNEGWLLARYRVMGHTGADQYPAIAHSGNTNNCIGLRISAAGFALQGNVRAAAQSKMSLATAIEHGAGIAAAGLVTWQSGYSCISGSGNHVPLTYSGDPSGITTLQVGARNGGNDPFYGHISLIEIGRHVLNTEQVARRLAEPEDLVVIGAGQSLMGGHFHSSDGGTQDGRKKTLEGIQMIRKGDHGIFLNGSTSSSAACKSSSDTNYWWDNAGGTPGPALSAFHVVLDTSGYGIDAILWAQGEQDSFYIGDETPYADYKTALLAIFANMRARVGAVPVFIQKIGRRTGAFNNAGGVQMIRAIQQELIDEYPWIYEASEIYDQSLYDDIHLSNAGYQAVGLRNGRMIAQLVNDLASYAGPRMTGATRTGTSVTVTLAHDGGTDFLPSSGISGFCFMDSNSEIEISSALRSDETTITLTLSGIPLSGTERLYYIYDTASAVSTANVVRDNAAIPMPLQSGVINLA